jgi:hypothetical protein
MLRFLMWNIGRVSDPDIVMRIASERDPHFLILVENRLNRAALLESLNGETDRFALTFGNCPKVDIYTCFDLRFVQAVEESPRFTIRRILLPAREPMLLVAAHLPDKMNNSEDSQALIGSHLGARIRSVEAKEGHTRTVLVGDMNMNPFEPGVVGAHALNSVSTVARAMRGSRTVNGESYPFFYNPMWRFFRDCPDHPPGTFHYSNAEQVTHFWNVFDQVMVRPALLRHFDPERVEVVSMIDGRPIVGKDWIPSGAGSDHLPVAFSLDL